MHSSPHGLPNPSPSPSTVPPNASPPPPPPSAALPPPHHRRARSELAFRIPDDIHLSGADAAGDPPGFDEDDLFSTFMDIEKIGSRIEGSGSGSEGGGCRDLGGEGEDRKAGNVGGTGRTAAPGRPKHRYSSSVDGSSASSVTSRGESVFGEVLEAKKSMSAEQLAELAAIDPKRAKRILANRQSAARSKERKARYISELERKVQTLQTEATTLSAQLTLYQRDTTGLTTENAELKIRLQAMEQQAQLHDALNEALRQEIQRLKFATGEISNAGETYNMGLQQFPYTPSFFSLPQQQPGHHQGIQLQQPFHQSQLSVRQLPPSPHHHTLSDMMQQEPLGRLQGLDISKGTTVVKSESSSVSESSSTV